MEVRILLKNNHPITSNTSDSIHRMNTGSINMENIFM